MKGTMAACLAAILFLPCAAGAASDGDYSRQYHVCMDKCDGSTASMLDCTRAELERQDKLLNEYYRKAMAGLGEKGRQKLREAQRAWITMRDADSEAIYEQGEGGTLSHIISGGHVLELTIDRVKFLRQLVEEQ